MGYWPIVKKVLREADIILLILDARMPDASINLELKKKIKNEGKELVVVYNKIDLISKKALREIQEKHPNAFYVAGIKNIGISNLKRALLIMGQRMKLDPPRIGVVGYPNMGKSAIINALAHRAKAKIASYAGTTKGLQLIKAGGLQVIDSPGVITFEDAESKLGVLGSKNPEKMENVHIVVFSIIKLFLEKGVKALEDFYGVDLKGETEEYDIMIKIGQRRGFLKKGGIVDEKRTAVKIVRDWQGGKLRLS